MHPLLASLTEPRRRKLGLAPVAPQADTLLLAAGAPVERVWFVEAGSARLVFQDPTSGASTVLDTLGAGDVLGLEGQDAAAFSRFEVRTDAGFNASAAPREAVLALLAEDSAFALAALKLFDGRVRVLQERLVDARSMKSMRASLRQMERALANAPQSRPGQASPEDQQAWFRSVKGKEFSLQFQAAGEAKPEVEVRAPELDGSVVVGTFNRLVGEALELGASDIHLEPTPAGLDVRYRLDGELLLRPERVPLQHTPAVLSRAKVLAGLDIAERRRPQDGRITVTAGGRTVDMRVSCVPTRSGEKVVLRILDPASMLIDLDQLVIGREVRETISGMLAQPCGVILVAGPTGSGKTTTVYSMLMAKKSEPVNIVTVEDPIEYVLRGITQVQRNPYVNLDFPHAVRAFLRQDPDVIVVGETRDPETAKAALEAGLTGHLVISTVHANNVFATAYRMKEMGTEPFIIANSLIGVLSQRLVRRVCPACARPTPYHRRLVDPMSLPGLAPASGDWYQFSRGPGCPQCNGRGYRGRVALFESLRITDALKPLIASDVPFTQLEQAAIRTDAYVSMRSYAAMLLTLGLTTPEEVSRVLFVENR